MALRRVGEVSVKRDASGQQYMEGYLQTREGGRKNKLLIVPNKDKKEDKDPDFILYRERKRMPGK